MRGYFAHLLLSCLLLLSCGLWAQLSVIIEQSPDYTPTTDSIYLVGSFNDWNPQDSNFLFTPLGDGQYRYSFLTPLPDFEFKITRGSWKTVEGGALGEAIGNRKYQNSGALKDTIRLRVKSWEDLREAIPFFDTIQVRVMAIPDNTPTDASLYIVGNFNGWSPADPDFKLQADADGSYFATIPLRSDTMEFKITRGSWAAIESRKNGLALPNRKFVLGKNNAQEIRQITVANWEDLAGNQLRWHSFILLLAVIQCILLVFAINAFKANNPPANRILSALIILMAITFFARLGAFNRNVFQQFPKLILLPDLIYFLYAPLFWLYLRKLVSADPLKKRRLFWHFVPLALAVIAYIPVLSNNQETFSSLVVSQQLKSFFITMAAAGLLFSGFYWWKVKRFLGRLKSSMLASQSDNSSFNFINTMFFIQSVCLAVWLSTYLIGGLGWWLGQDWTSLTDGLTDASWLILALGAFAMSYYVIRQPHLFRVPPLETIPTSPSTTKRDKLIDVLAPAETVLPTSVKTAEHHKQRVADVSATELVRLEEIMNTDKPYLNPGLHMAELAEIMQMPSHQLSKLINDGFQKNFFDFVNTYRVEAFKERIVEGHHQQHTILSIALDVGFNSKTAFNRAFKKHTQLTPRQYLRQLDSDA